MGACLTGRLSKCWNLSALVYIFGVKVHGSTAWAAMESCKSFFFCYIDHANDHALRDECCGDDVLDG